jgi:hypothetical protein
MIREDLGTSFIFKQWVESRAKSQKRSFYNFLGLLHLKSWKMWIIFEYFGLFWNFSDYLGLYGYLGGFKLSAFDSTHCTLHLEILFLIPFQNTES